MTAVTLGARSVPRLRAFYRSIGWDENEGSDDSFSSFAVGDVRLALHPLELLGQEAAPGAGVVEPPAWNAVTFTLNVSTRDEVDRGVETAVAAGASAIGSPAEREWGGYSGYFADPEGQRWEIAWAPWLTDLD
ncbi:MAG: glyoxalase [Acidimicrobiia bacterium]|nr:glyoxalase [Acidimicrobiia bacterium]